MSVELAETSEGITPSNADLAYQLIRERLVMLDIRPSEPINDEGLARQLGFGRTPVREALKRLERDRLVIAYPRRGTFATTVDGKLAFGLPGFPVSSLVTFEVFVRPALLKLGGAERVLRPRVAVELGHDVRPAAFRDSWLYGRRDRSAPTRLQRERDRRQNLENHWHGHPFEIGPVPDAG